MSELHPASVSAGHNADAEKGDREIPLKASGDLSGAQIAYQEARQDEFTPEETRKLKRKLDWRILPCLCLLNGFSYVDKASLSWAVPYGFEKAAHLHGKDYQWASSLFYFGYMAGQIPANYLLTRLPAAKVAAFCTLVWGALLLGQMGVTNRTQIWCIRFFLGLCESPMVPIMVQFTSMWYTRAEQVPRALIWGSMQGLLSMVFSAIAYGAGNLSENHFPVPWQLVFLVLYVQSVLYKWGIKLTALALFRGLCSIILAAFWIIQPEQPHTARFLNERERLLATRRAAENMFGSMEYGASTWKNYQIWHTVKDPLVWLIMVYTFVGHIPNGGLTAFNTLVIKDALGFNSRITMLVSIPQSVFSAGGLILWSLAARRYHSLRTLGLSMPLILSIAGIATVYATSHHPERYNKWGRAFAFWMINSYAVCFPFLLSTVGANFAGRTKRAVIYALLLLFYSVGDIVGPFLFPSTSSTYYTESLGVVLSMFCVEFALGLVIRYYMIWSNKRRDRIYGVVENAVEGAEESLEDKTDNENVSFRYVY